MTVKNGVNVLKVTRAEGQKARTASVRQSARELAAVLANLEGLRRLREISDQEWQEAVDEEAVSKYNPHHDERGRFASGGGAGGGAMAGAVSITGDASEAAVGMTREALEGFPGWATTGVEAVELHEGQSAREFTAGGQDFREGAHWDARERTVRMWNMESRSAEQIQGTLGHEVGHSLHDRWFTGAIEQDRAVYGQHPEWFNMAGEVLPAHRGDFNRAAPLVAARERFFSIWSPNNDGITPYSMAWARDGNFGETIAEMSRFYFSGGRSGLMRAVRNAGVNPELANAFVDAMEAMARG